MSDYGRGNLLARALEGVTLALDSVRASKVRAALTILGVAIGVMVVIAMAATITGIQNSVSRDRPARRPEVVLRDALLPLRASRSPMARTKCRPGGSRPMMTREEAEMISRLPADRRGATSASPAGSPRLLRPEGDSWRPDRRSEPELAAGRGRRAAAGPQLHADGGRRRRRSWW
ncbi:MAG: ABC transporter permease [Gemmatimonadales bacterium]